GRASAKEFVEGVRARVGEGVWRPYLEPHVLRVFFRAKKNGLPDAYHKISEAEIAERGQVATELSATRDDQMRLCAADAQARIERDKRRGSVQSTIANARLAETHRLNRICNSRSPR
ncbi:unnamed protein product, partial [Ectocarpus sp. 12 AP-2014]